jgi:hypothetical protein
MATTGALTVTVTEEKDPSDGGGPTSLVYVMMVGLLSIALVLAILLLWRRRTQ